MTSAPVPDLAPFTAASLTSFPSAQGAALGGPKPVLCGAVPSEWKAAPPVPRAVAWRVLSGAVRLIYGQPEETNEGGTLALLSPQTVDLDAGQSFVVWPGTAVVYRATGEGTHVDWREP